MTKPASVFYKRHLEHQKEIETEKKQFAVAQLKALKAKKKESNKKLRHKAGYKEADRLCVLCNKEIRGEKDGIKLSQALIRHHMQYDPDYIKSVHFACHEILSSRCKYGNFYMKKYGADFGPVATSFDILRMYRPVMLEFYKKFPEFRDREMLFRGPPNV